ILFGYPWAGISYLKEILSFIPFLLSDRTAVQFYRPPFGRELDGLQRIFLEDVFTLFGVRFSFVSEPETAMEVLRHAKNSGHGYDLVLLNQRPGRDSRQVCRVLRNVEAGPKFILLTDLLDQGWDHAVELPGICTCLRKPVSADRLRSAIEWLLARDGTQPTLAVQRQKEIENPVIYKDWILVVDDHGANLTVARGMLVRLGCNPAHIITAVDGREGVERFTEKPFQLVFMDCQMPGLDGYEASQTIRQWEKEHQKSPVPIVAFTANVTSGNRQRGKLAGMDDFLAKPVTLSELQGVLERFLTPEVQILPQDSLPREVIPTTDCTPCIQNDGNMDLDILLGAMESIGLPEEDFRDVAELLVNQIPELLANLERELQAGDHEMARATAHVLKGSMANTIFPQLQPHTRLLHETIKNQSWEEAAEALHTVRDHFMPVRKALETFLHHPRETNSPP
ncbi:MAG: response regulator, partial [Magnetococcales bacterium]|nr:response regulator [Magnetococcales bacterium]